MPFDSNKPNEATSTSKKRKRSKNFTELEVRFLVNLVIQYINMIENKKTDAVMWKEKENMWNRIANEFEALSGNDRGSSVLRSKYDSVKQALKSKLSKNKMEIFKTGGGVADLVELTDYENKLMGYLQLNIQGLPCKFDSDHEISIVNVDSTPSDESGGSRDSAINFVVDTNMFTTEVNTAAQLSIKNSVVLTDSICNKNNEGPGSAVNTEKLLEIVAETEKEKENTPTQWTSWNPKLLKEKKHRKLSVPSYQQKKTTKDELNNKLDIMVEHRTHMLQLQTEAMEKDIKLKAAHLEAEQQFQNKEHDLKLRLLELKIEKQKLAIQLIKQQLGHTII